MLERSGDSFLIRWAYRASVILCLWGLLGGLYVAYIEWLEGDVDRAVAGMGLGLASFVLAFSLMIARRRSLADDVHKPQALTLPHRQSYLSEADNLDTPAVASNGREVQLEVALRQAVDLICAPVEFTKLSSLVRVFENYRQLQRRLQVLEEQEWAENLSFRLAEIERRVKQAMREAFVVAVRARRWKNALSVAELVKLTFPKSELAQEISELVPRLIQKSQEDEEAIKAGEENDSREPHGSAVSA